MFPEKARLGGPSHWVQVTVGGAVGFEQRPFTASIHRLRPNGDPQIH